MSDVSEAAQPGLAYWPPNGVRALNAWVMKIIVWAEISEWEHIISGKLWIIAHCWTSCIIGMLVPRSRDLTLVFPTRFSYGTTDVRVLLRSRLRRWATLNTLAMVYSTNWRQGQLSIADFIIEHPLWNTKARLAFVCSPSPKAGGLIVDTHMYVYAGASSTV